MRRNPMRGKSSESGVALLFVLFLMLLVLVGASIAILRFEDQGLRQKEAVMIWRGEQYERAIGLYYRKFGRYPTSMDQLVKGVNGVRFLREEYTDPMNKADGSWRLIYVTPAGQLIGSVRYVTLQQMALADRARIMGISLSQELGANNGLGSNAVPPPDANGQSASGNSSGAPAGAAAGGASAPPGGSPPDQSQSGQQPTPPQPAPPQPAPFGVMQQSQPFGGQLQDNELAGQVIGGFIVGVGSKIDKPSLKVYKGGTTYKQWEFIYNPLEQVQAVSGTVGGVIGTMSGAPVSPQPQPPKPPQNPQVP